MQKIIVKNLSFTVALVAIALLGSFMFSERPQQDGELNGKISIVTSFYPHSYIAGKVGGNAVKLRNLVPAGTEAHDFEPSAQDFVSIGKADIFIYNGAAFEPWINKWQESTSFRPKYIIDMSTALKERGAPLIMDGNMADPHFWLDPSIMKIEAEVVHEALAGLSPVNKEIFANNLSRVSADLETLDKRYRSELSSCALQDVIVLHEAFNYMAERYKFRITSIAGISPDEEPSPRDLTRIISLAKAKNVKHIFSEAVASPKFSELIANEIGGATLVLNPIESLLPSEVQLNEDYISLMERNLVNLKKAMLCNQ